MSLRTEGRLRVRLAASERGRIQERRAVHLCHERIEALEAALKQIRANGGAWEARIAKQALGEHVDP